MLDSTSVDCLRELDPLCSLGLVPYSVSSRDLLLAERVWEYHWWRYTLDRRRVAEAAA